MATADLRLTFGAMFIGCVISVSFSGMGALQAYLYLRKSRRRDSLATNLIVLSTWLLDVAHTVFICQGIWHYLVLNWGDLNELDHLTWTIAGSIALTGCITIMVHLFYAQRVYRLSLGNRPLTLLIVVLACARLGSALTTTGEMLRIGRISHFINQFRWLFTLGLALSFLIDILITGSLCYYLHGSRTGYSGIDDIIHRLVLYTINNGVLTSFASFIDMLMAATMPHNFIFLSMHFIIAKCYVNSLLATLNSRDSLRECHDDGEPTAIAITMDDLNMPRFVRQKSKMSRTSHSSRASRHSRGTPRDTPAASPASPVSAIGPNASHQTATINTVQVHVERTVHIEDAEKSSYDRKSDTYEGSIV